MAAKKYMALIAGRMKQVIATIISTGAPNDGDLVALDASGRLDATVMPVGVAADVKAIVASEALSAGDFVNIWNNAGTVNVRKADATTEGKECDGYVLAAVSSGASATVYFEATNTARTGLTAGSGYWLSTTAGNVTVTSPTGSGNVSQYIGKAISTTEISFEPNDPVTVA